MKRLYIDGLGLVDPHFSGVGQYILGMLKGLDEALEEMGYKFGYRPEVKIIIPYDKIKKFNKYKFNNIGVKRFPMSYWLMSGLWSKRMMPPIDLWCGRGIYFFPRFVDMPLLFSKSVVTIHDLSYVLYRQFSDEKNADFLSKNIPLSIKRSLFVATVSGSVKEALEKMYSIEPGKTLITSNAADNHMFYRRSLTEVASVKKKYHIPSDYILSLSNLEPRKNLEALINAYCSLPKDITDNVALLLVGVSGWKTDELFSKILDKVKEGYNIIRPSKYVSDLDKPAIISGAKMLVYPSHYEGFGMPPLEALACGTPVICANNSSLPEVVGQAGTLVDIDDEQALVKVMQDTLDNLSEVTKKAILSGPKQAEKYSWVDSARVLLSALEGQQ